MPYPSLPTEEYRKKLKAMVMEPMLQNHLDDPNTPENERRTFCNLGVRTVVRWFGFDKWKPATLDGERASDIWNWMSAHPEHWQPLTIPTGHPDFRAARDAAVLGQCVVAAQVNPPVGPVPKGGWKASGHVAVVAPEQYLYASGSFNTRVCLLANVGGSKGNEYGISLSKCFRPDPPVGLWLLVKA